MNADEPQNEPKTSKVTVYVFSVVLLLLVAFGTGWYLNERHYEQKTGIASGEAIKRLESAAGQMEQLVQAVNDRRLLIQAKSCDAAILQGRQAIKEGKTELAKIYFLNAVNHMPESMAAVQEYADTVLTKKNPGIDEIDQAISIVQLSLYQVPASEVQHAIQKLQTLQGARAKALESTKPLVPPSDWTTVAERIRTVDPNVVCNDDAKLQAQIGDIRSMLEHLTDAVTEDERKMYLWAEKEMQRYTQIEAATRQVRYIDACLAKLEKADLASDYAVAIIQAAENSLPQFWGMDSSMIPITLQAKIKTMPENIQAAVGKVADARAKSALDEIGRLCENIKAAHASLRGNRDTGNPAGSGPGQFETCAKEIQSSLEKIAGNLAKVSSAGKRKDADAQFQEMAKILREVRQGQYNAYQKWALGICENALSKYEAINWTARKPVPGLTSNDEEAKAIFKNTFFPQIDPTLLTPEISTIYSTVQGKLFGKMDPGSTVDCSNEILKSKRPLENF